MTNINVSAGGFAFVQTVVSPNEFRAFMEGVNIEADKERGGAWIVGTDAHKLNVYYDETADLNGADSINVKPLKIANLAAVKFSDRLTIKNDADDGTFLAEIITQQYARKIEIAEIINEIVYPDWRQILKGRKQWQKSRNVELNARFITQVAKNAHKLTDAGTNQSPVHTRMGLCGEDTALITYPQNKNAFSIVMAMRDEDSKGNDLSDYAICNL